MFEKKYLYYALPAIVLSALLAVTIIFAWTDPGVSPPLGNVDAPLNIGSEPQGKMGALGIGIASPVHKLHVVGGNIYAPDNVWGSGSSATDCILMGWTCDATQECSDGRFIVGIERYTTGSLCPIGATSGNRWYQMKIRCCRI